MRGEAHRVGLFLVLVPDLVWGKASYPTSSILMTLKVKSGCRSGEIVQRLLLIPPEPPNLHSYASLLEKLPGKTFWALFYIHYSNFSSLFSSSGIFLRAKKPSCRGRDKSHDKMPCLGTLSTALRHIWSLHFCSASKNEIQTYFI